MRAILYPVISLLLSAFLLLAVDTSAQKGKKKKRNEATASGADQNEEDKNGVLQYDEFIKSDFSVDEGLFRILVKEGTYYYEIPDTLLGRDMLLVSRIVRLPEGFGGGYVNAGSKRREQLVRWEKHDQKVLLRILSYHNVAPDTLPIYHSVQSNNHAAIIHAFDIEAIGRDSASYVVKVNDLYEQDVKAISGLDPENRKEYKISGVDGDRTFIRHIHAYPSNIEVRHELTYHADDPPSDRHVGAITLVLNQSMVLLPEEPMQPRVHDPRVGWFTVKKIDYGSGALKSKKVEYIRRWRLEPSDSVAYARGVLVEPKKPIVYYIDPATPAKWRPYFRQGVELWQEVFETAGFVNAIRILDPPAADEDRSFSPEDVRYSVIRYVASTTRNAMGPSVVDPRSGEIIESDIIWYHNHLRSYRNRYLIETGGANRSARTLDTPEEEIGEMMKMVIAHEVGHALGLPHNMKASSAYPVDSLRSPSFTRKYGIAATIMDYARFNYVAQPGDGDVRFIRQIGPYDHYAINWGYRFIPGIGHAHEEKDVLDRWIEQHVGDPVYRFGRGYSGDPSAQTEDVGNDPVKASAYGLQNLERVASGLLEWTTKIGDDYEELEELYGELFAAWSRYAGHVITNIGGVYQTRLHRGTPGVPYEPVPRKVQKESLSFLLQYVFDNHRWLLRREILQRTGTDLGVQKIRKFQRKQLEKLLDLERLTRLEEHELLPGDDHYGLSVYMDDLRVGIWRGVLEGKPVDIHRRNLHRAYLDILERMISGTPKASSPAPGGDPAHSVIANSEIGPAVYRQIRLLRRQLDAVLSDKPAGLQRDHLLYALHRIDQMMSDD